jgi:hypothetical protein
MTDRSNANPAIGTRITIFDSAANYLGRSEGDPVVPPHGSALPRCQLPARRGNPTQSLAIWLIDRPNRPWRIVG